MKSPPSHWTVNDFSMSPAVWSPRCPFPAAPWPAEPRQRPLVYAYDMGILMCNECIIIRYKMVLLSSTVMYINKRIIYIYKQYDYIHVVKCTHTCKSYIHVCVCVWKCINFQTSTYPISNITNPDKFHIVSKGQTTTSWGILRWKSCPCCPCSGTFQEGTRTLKWNNSNDEQIKGAGDNDDWDEDDDEDEDDDDDDDDDDKVDNIDVDVGVDVDVDIVCDYGWWLSASTAMIFAISRFSDHEIGNQNVNQHHKNKASQNFTNSTVFGAIPKAKTNHKHRRIKENTISSNACFRPPMSSHCYELMMHIYAP